MCCPAPEHNDRHPRNSLKQFVLCGTAHCLFMMTSEPPRFNLYNCEAVPNSRWISPARQLSRVAWSEGMYLGPHHFQAQSAYFESAIHFMGAALWFEPYGFLACDLDAEALRNGTAALVHARGIFPDGLAFQMPECDPLPAARPIADLIPPTRDRVTLSLGVPDYKPTGVNLALNGEVGSGTRFIAEERKAYDENTGQDEKLVRFARKNIRIILDTEPSDGLITLPLARVLRDGSGHFIYDERFILPCVQISASERLMTLTRRLVEILNEKSMAVSAAGAGRKFSGGMSAQQVASFWFLHALDSSLAPLRHICFSQHGHPEQLYSELLRLGGALCTFGLDSQPASLPLYNHLNLEECFEDLDRHIREHLEMLAPSNCISIALKPAAKYFHQGAINDSRCMGRSRWILGISSPMGEANLITATSQLVKVCSAKFVGELVKRALPGLTLTHLSVPPSAISPKVTSQYFAITKSGPCWDHIVETKDAGIYIPGDIPNAEVELLVVLET
jgi:type VI secretion system protein ImpJ